MSVLLRVSVDVFSVSVNTCMLLCFSKGGRHGVQHKCSCGFLCTTLLFLQVQGVLNVPVGTIKNVFSEFFLQVQGALKRQWWLYTAQWRGQLWTSDSHGFHTGASITETSRATISLSCQDVEDKITLKHQHNGDSNGICSCSSDPNVPKLLETTEV